MHLLIELFFFADIGVSGDLIFAMKELCCSSR